MEGDDSPGLGSQITAAIANAGINLRSVSGTVIGRKFVVYLGFDGAADATKGVRALKTLASPKKAHTTRRASCLAR
jgi:predicted amino acid-binding ACT domain protein